MSGERIAVVLWIFVCSAGMAMGQTEWEEHPDNPVIGPGEPGSWNDGGNWIGNVVFDGSTYHMWFSGMKSGTPTDIGHATSVDGVEWTMDQANPVLTGGEPGDWDADYVIPGGVIYDGTHFHMWFTGSTYVPDDPEQVGYATSPDGSVWTKHPENPVLEVGSQGSWDSYTVRAGTVMLDGGTYRMWYSGAQPYYEWGGIGYAESEDGIQWTKHPEPVLTAGEYPGSPGNLVSNSCVVFDGSEYHMWYGLGDETNLDLGYAFSSDGIRWNQHRENPVIQSTEELVYTSAVIRDGSNWHMWYSHFDGSIDWINYATSHCCAGVADLSHMQTIPAAAVASGAQDSFYQTDVDLNNAGEQPVEYQFMWFPRGEINTEPTTSETFSLGAGMSVRYGNVLSEVFGLEPNSFGALSIMSSSPYLLAMSRTYNNPTGEDAGTFGQAIPAVAPGDFIQTGERRRILFASENEDLRFNVGCQNGGDLSMVVNLELFDAEGTSLEQTMMILRAWGNDQLNRIFQDYMPVNGYVDVWTTLQNKSFYCYGSVLDNVTSDPTTILPQ